MIVIVYAKVINREITEKSNCFCLHQAVNSGTQNYANNKEFELNRAYVLIYELIF